MRQRKLNIGERPYVALHNLLGRHIVSTLRMSPCNAIRVYRGIFRRHEIKIGSKSHAARLIKRGDLGWMRKDRLLRKADTAFYALVLQKVHKHGDGVGIYGFGDMETDAVEVHGNRTRTESPSRSAPRPCESDLSFRRKLFDKFLATIRPSADNPVVDEDGNREPRLKCATHGICAALACSLGQFLVEFSHVSPRIIPNFLSVVKTQPSATTKLGTTCDWKTVRLRHRGEVCKP